MEMNTRREMELNPITTRSTCIAIGWAGKLNHKSRDILEFRLFWNACDTQMSGFLIYIPRTL